MVDKTTTNKEGKVVTLNFKENKDWLVIKDEIEKLFSITIEPPIYEKGVDTQITCNYKQDKKTFDIIAGGSGFHQMLTLLAFMYGYEGIAAILLDEPDAHMHANLQREMVDFFKQQSMRRNIQFVIATHAEELIQEVAPTSIVSILKTKPERVEAIPKIITALSNVNNIEITKTTESPFILYLEGESDERILRAWAQVLKKGNSLNKFFIRPMGGGSKKQMKEDADRHFDGLRQIVPHVKRIMLFDYDSDDEAFNLKSDNEALYEWKRKNIENYLIVREPWHRTANKNMGYDLFFSKLKQVIDEFFDSQNLMLPKNAEWKTVEANIFKVVAGKKILYEDEDSLFQRLRSLAAEINFNKETIAANMLETEIHNDVVLFFEKLEIISR